MTGDSTLSLSALHVGARVDGNRDFSIQRLTASPYTVINLVGTHELTRSTTLLGRVENLTDRQYQDPTGFERPGLGIFVGVKVRYDAAP